MILVDKKQTVTSLGCLSKAWYSDKGSLYLVKGNLSHKAGYYGYEPYAEVIASVVAEALCLPHVTYTLALAKDFPAVKVYGLPAVSVCKAIQTPSYCQKLSCYRYMELYYGKSVDTNYWTLFRQLPFDKTSTFNMFILDAIIGNTDRHLNNWEYFVDYNGSVSLVPIFDFGESLLTGVSCVKPYRTNQGIGMDKAKPFKATHYQQLCLIKRCYPDYHFCVDIDTAWQYVDSSIRPILGSMPDAHRASEIYDYLHRRFYFFLNLMR